jgi:hypothetical protein
MLTTLLKPLLDFKDPVQTPVDFEGPCLNPCWILRTLFKPLLDL